MSLRKQILTLLGIIAMALCADAADRVPPSNNIQAALDAARRSPRGKACWSATKFFIYALCRNRIPDCKASEEGSFTTDTGPLNDFGAVNYPISFTFKLTKHDPIIFGAPAASEMRETWLERLWTAHEAD